MRSAASGRCCAISLSPCRNAAIAIASLAELRRVGILAGLFIAHAWESGAMHTAGIALFVISGAIIFLDMKQVFDRMQPPKR